MAEVIITKDNFEQEVLNSDIPVIVDFWATWCGPCKMLAPVLEEFAKEHDDTVKVGKVNVDDEPELAIKFGIVSIPTLIVFEKGEKVNMSVGYCTADEIAKLVGV